MSKRYVFFIATLGKGGAERVVSLLTRKMAEEGQNVEILLYLDGEVFYDVDSRIKITKVQKETKSKNLLKNLIWMRKFFKERADVVVSFLASFNMICICSLMFSGVPVIVADRSDPRQAPANKFLRKLRNFLYRFADGVVLQTENNKSYFSKFIQKKSYVIANPVDLGEKNGIALTTAKEKEIVTAGRLIKAKNQELLIRAFAEIHKEFPEYRLVIYGDGSCKENLEKMVDELNLRDCVRLPGNQKDIFDKISKAEVFVLSSDCEGMPNALLEAMCLGLPVVSTKVSGATDVIVDGENGILVDCGSVEQMADAIRRMLTDEQLRESCAKNATQLAEKLTIGKICGQWADVAEKANRRSKKARGFKERIDTK